MSPELAQVASGLGGVIAGGLITAIGNYVTKRHTTASSKAQDFQTVVEGFHGLVGELQQECKRLGEKADAMSQKVGELSEVVEALTGHIDGLEATMRRSGMTPPSRPKLRTASRS